MTDYAAAVWRCRNFWLALVLNDLQLRYRRSVLGIGWSLLHPLATAIVLGMVFHEIFHRPIREYLPYLLCGLACWAYLTGTILQGCQTYIQAEPYIRQFPLPLAVYPVRTTLGLMIHFLIALGLVVGLSVGLNGWRRIPDFGSVCLAIPILLVFGWGVSALAGFANVAFRDTQHIMEVILQIAFYLTPIIYPPDFIAPTRFGWVLEFNPLASMIDIVRTPVLGGASPPLEVWLSASAIAGIVALTAAGTLYQQQRRVVLYL